MFTQILYIFLAALGLGLLVFIHELAHFWMAKRVGMRVEAFSIGFGKAIIQWKQNGVQWRIGWLPFGGYVKIAGMQKENGVEPHDIPGGYFSKKPLDRIKVAAIAPIVNIVVAFLLFTAIWMLGGREKPFHDNTNRIGWVALHSEAAQKGIGPGDQITQYNNRKYKSFKDLFQGTMLTKGHLRLKGYSFDYLKGTKTPFDVEILPYQHPQIAEKGILTSGIMAPASYLLYNPTNSTPSLAENSPLAQSNLTAGDRLVWMDGQLLFSNVQLNELVNTKYSLLTVQRQDETFLATIPRINSQELRINPYYRDELKDYQYEQAKGSFYILPYQINSALEVVQPLNSFDDSTVLKMPKTGANLVQNELQSGDKIIAVDGQPVSQQGEFYQALQSHQCQIIVQSNNANLPLISTKEANQTFEKNISFQNLVLLSNGIGLPNSSLSQGELKRLNPVTAIPLSELVLKTNDVATQKEIALKQEKIEAIEDPQEKEKASNQLSNALNRLYLGALFQDRVVLYNPPPYVLFAQVTGDIFHTLKALFTGGLNPKWLSGPVGIVQVMHQGWSLGLKEALFWLALISLNLGFLNLLPIPVLDGGHICFALYEICTKKRLSSKAMERIVLPFVVLLIGFFVFVTFHDLSRLIKGFM